MNPSAIMLRHIGNTLKARVDRLSLPEMDGLTTWGQRFFPHYFTLSPCEMHIRFGRMLLQMHDKRGQKQLKVSPRGSGKSVYSTFLDPLYAICENKEKYILIMADTYSQAVKHLKGIQAELEENKELSQMYPDVCGVGPEWSDSGILTRNGIRIEPLGTGQKIRGRRENAARPSLILIDDPQSDEIAYSAIQREHDWDWLTKGVLKAGDKNTNIVVNGTNIHRDSIVGRLSNQPGWQVDFDRALDPMPDRMELWTEWELIYCQMANKNRVQDARAFFERHQAEMTKGAKVLWSESEDLYALMCLRAEGHASFESEKQNNPIDPSKCEWSGMLDDLYFDEWPSGIQVKTIGVDSAGGAKSHSGDFAAIVKIAKVGDLFYVDADLKRQGVTTLIDDLLMHHKMFRADCVGVEADQFQHLVVQEVIRVAKDSNIIIPVVPVLTKGINKEVRIRRLGPFIHMRAFRFKANSPGASILLRQLQEFPNADHDDGPDGMDIAMQIMLGLLNAAEDEVQDQNLPSHMAVAEI